MALCSQAFNANKRRSCSSFSSLPNQKKVCLRNVSFKYPQSPMDLSSSEDDNDSEDEQSCYNADQARARRRASTRISFSLDTDLSRAVSKYSDEDENEELRLIKNEEPAVEDTPVFSFEDQTEEIAANLSGANAASPSVKNSSDKTARSRCFEYLVGSIDEAWARYCDAATNVEDEVYGYNTPASVATDDEDYLDNTTDITDYETDYDDKKASFRPRLSSSALCASLLSTKEDPSSCQLQALKDRLTKAKYYLQDLVDSDDPYDVESFWKRWDMIKYATIELVEDDDDDEVVEGMIDELERGRC